MGRVSGVRLRPSHGAEGFRGHAAVVIDGVLRIDMIEIYRMNDGRVDVAMPLALDRRGGMRKAVQVINAHMRREIRERVAEAYEKWASGDGPARMKSDAVVARRVKRAM